MDERALQMRLTQHAMQEAYRKIPRRVATQMRIVQKEHTERMEMERQQEQEQKRLQEEQYRQQQALQEQH
ncbi:hypothetical protein C0991_009410, partial [Blastosporella zonata]